MNERKESSPLAVFKCTSNFSKLNSSCFRCSELQNSLISRIILSILSFSSIESVLLRTLVLSVHCSLVTRTPVDRYFFFLSNSTSICTSASFSFVADFLRSNTTRHVGYFILKKLVEQPVEHLVDSGRTQR